MNHENNAFFGVNYQNNTIFKITSSGMETSHSLSNLIVLTHHQGVVSVFAGSGQQGSNDGIGTKASFWQPRWLAIERHTGNLFVSDYGNGTIRKITPEGELIICFEWSIILAKIQWIGAVTTLPKLDYIPKGICYDDSSQSLIVCDWKNNKIIRVQLNGMNHISAFSHPDLIIFSPVLSSLSPP